MSVTGCACNSCGRTSRADSSILRRCRRDHELERPAAQSRRLQGRGVPRQRRRASAAHPRRISRADARLPPRTHLRHDRVLRLRPDHARRSARSLLRRRPRACAPRRRMVGRVSPPTRTSMSSAPVAAAGIMEAANRGAADAGGKTIGLNIGLPQEQRPNPYLTRELTFEFHYFFMRKLWFAHLARALVVFPGGFGTLDELLEILTLMQTRKIERRIPIVLYGSKYWNEILNFEALVRHGMIDREDLDLFRFADDPASALEILKTGIEEDLKQATPSIAHSRTAESLRATLRALLRVPLRRHDRRSERQVLGIGDLEVGRIAGHESRLQTHRFHGLGFVGAVGRFGAGERVAQHAVPEHLRRLRAPQALARLGPRHCALPRRHASRSRPWAARAGRRRRRAEAPAAAASTRPDRYRDARRRGSGSSRRRLRRRAPTADCGRFRRASRRRSARPSPRASRRSLRRTSDRPGRRPRGLAAAESPPPDARCCARASACRRASSIAWASHRENGCHSRPRESTRSSASRTSAGFAVASGRRTRAMPDVVATRRSRRDYT